MVAPSLTAEGRWRSRTLGTEDDFYRQRSVVGCIRTPAPRFSHVSVAGNDSHHFSNAGSNSTSDLKAIVGTPETLSDHRLPADSFVWAKAEQWSTHRQLPGLCLDPMAMYNHGDHPELNILRVYKELTRVAVRSAVEDGVSTTHPPPNVRRLLCTLSEFNEWVQLLCMCQLGVSPLAFESILTSPDGQAGRDVERSLCDFTGPRLRRFAASLVECVALQSKIFGILADAMSVQPTETLGISRDSVILPSTPVSHQPRASTSPPATPTSSKIASAELVTPAMANSAADPFGLAESVIGQRPNHLAGLQVPQLDLDALLGPTVAGRTSLGSNGGADSPPSCHSPDDDSEPFPNTTSGGRRAARRAVILGSRRLARHKGSSLSSRSAGESTIGSGTAAGAGTTSSSSIATHDGLDLRPQWMKEPRVQPATLSRLSSTGMPAVAYCEWNIVAFHRILSDRPADRIVSPPIPLSDRRSPMRFMVTATRNPLKIRVEFTVAEPIEVLYRVVCGEFVSAPSWHSFKESPWAGIHDALELSASEPPVVLTVGILIEDIRPLHDSGSRQMPYRVRSQTDWSTALSRRVDSVDDIIAELNQRQQTMAVEALAEESAYGGATGGISPLPAAAGGGYHPLSTAANLPSLSNLIQMSIHRPSAAASPQGAGEPGTVATSVHELLHALGAAGDLGTPGGLPAGTETHGHGSIPHSAVNSSNNGTGGLSSGALNHSQAGQRNPGLGAGAASQDRAQSHNGVRTNTKIAGASSAERSHGGHVALPLQPTLSRLHLNGLSSALEQHQGHADNVIAADVEATGDLFRRIWNNDNTYT